MNAATRRKEEPTGNGIRCARHPAVAALLLLVALLVAVPAPAQQGPSWGQLTAIGFGTGTLAWYITAAEADDFDSVGDLAGWMIFKVPLAGAVGAAVGAYVGHSADEAVRRGEALGPIHLTTVSAGTLLAGASAGLSAWALVARGSDAAPGTFVLSTPGVLTFAGLGAMAGAGLLVYRWDELRGRAGPERFTVEPVFSREGGFGARVRIGFEGVMP